MTTRPDIPAPSASIATVEWPRRRVLQTVLAAGTLPWLAAPSLARTVQAGATPALHGPRHLRALSKSLQGRLLLPGEEGYTLAAFPNNARWADVKPKAVALCASSADVALCLAWARDQRQRFAVRSGGHNYAGFSTTDGLLISVRPMNGIRLDRSNMEVTVQGGVSNQDMANAFGGTGLAVPSGRCPTVGVSGLVLGGGWGFAATHSGLTCDSLLASDVVLANGEQVSAQAGSGAAGQHEDLFWALRGGGGGNFGVNTGFKFRVHPVGQVTVFNITWPGQKQVQLLRAIQAIQLQHATGMSTRFKALPHAAQAQPARADLRVAALGLFWGSEAQAREALGPALTLVQPLSADIRSMDYWQARDYMVTDDPNGLYDLRSAYVGEGMSEDGFETMLQWMSRWPGGSMLPENMGLFFAIGGKVRDVAAHATAYVHRNANFLFEMECAWSPLDKPDVVRRQRDWLAQYFAAMQPHVLPQAYVNFPNRDQPNWARAYYGANLERLSQVKRRYDPGNLFRFAQSIPPGA